MVTRTTPQRNLRIVADAEPKGNLMLAEKPESEGANKFPIRCQAVAALPPKLPQEPAHKPNPFAGIGIPAFIEERQEEGGMATL